MKDILTKIADYENRIQNSITSKIASKQALTDEEIRYYKLTDDDKEAYKLLTKLIDGEKIPFKFKDFLASPSASVLIPRTIIGAMRKAADPLYLASQFFSTIRINQGTVTQFPSIGITRAHDVAEGQEIPEANIDWQLHKSSQINIGKSGVRVQVTQDLIQDADWDIVGMLIAEAGRAMARLKEEKAFIEWKSHGHIVFDNNLYKSDPTTWVEAKTNGVDYNGNPNFTMSIEDFLDLIIVVYNNEYTCTDLVMHPLAWTCLAKNGLTGGFSSPFDREAKRETAQGSFAIGPNSIQGRIPFALNVNLSPFATIDNYNKTFDLYAVDRNNVGVLIVKQDLATEEFNDPSRDIRNIKITEKYGYGIYNEGRAIAVAKNISMAKSYPLPERVKQL